MTKHKHKSIGQRFANTKLVYFILLALFSAIVSLYSLRANNEHMSVLRSAVYNADQTNGDIKGSLDNLRSYVTTHMNTSLSSGQSSVYPPIQLKYTYNRLVEQQATSLSSQNSKVYSDAESYCQKTVPDGVSGRNRIPCVEQYVTSHGLKMINVEQSLYEFDFVSPWWSPDITGWSILLSIIFLKILAIRIIYGWYYRRYVE